MRKIGTTLPTTVINGGRRVVTIKGREECTKLGSFWASHHLIFAAIHHYYCYYYYYYYHAEVKLGYQDKVSKLYIFFILFIKF